MNYLSKVATDSSVRVFLCEIYARGSRKTIVVGYCLFPKSLIIAVGQRCELERRAAAAVLGDGPAKTNFRSLLLIAPAACAPRLLFFPLTWCCQENGFADGGELSRRLNGNFSGLLRKIQQAGNGIKVKLVQINSHWCEFKRKLGQWIFLLPFFNILHNKHHYLE